MVAENRSDCEEICHERKVLKPGAQRLEIKEGSEVEKEPNCEVCPYIAV
jgi:hypothetical protein